MGEIAEFLEPKDIYATITSNEYPYSPSYKKGYACRDRAMMSFTVETAGRITEVVGGPEFQWQGKITQKKLVQNTVITLIKAKGKAVVVGRHEGLTREKIQVTPDHILIKQMEIVKRSRKLKQKYGPQIARRGNLALPLKCGYMKPQAYDQFVPFSWLIIEYLANYAPEKGKLFGYEDTRAWSIIKTVTGWFPNWFRAQTSSFRANFIDADATALQKFRGDTNPVSAGHYYRYDYKRDLADPQQALDFTWITPAIKEIQQRIPEQALKKLFTT